MASHQPVLSFGLLQPAGLSLSFLVTAIPSLRHRAEWQSNCVSLTVSDLRRGRGLFYGHCQTVSWKDWENHEAPQDSLSSTRDSNPVLAKFKAMPPLQISVGLLISTRNLFPWGWQNWHTNTLTGLKDCLWHRFPVERVSGYVWLVLKGACEAGLFWQPVMGLVPDCSA